MPERKKFNMSGIDTVTLEVLYLDKCLRISEIASITGKTRQRVWQVLKQTGLHNKSRVVRQCLYCGKSFEVVRSKVRNGIGKYCNNEHYHAHREQVNDYKPWRQGQRKSRAVIEAWLGFTLPTGFVVHHEDGNQTNVSLGNLWVFKSNADHLAYHHAKRHGNAVLPYKDIVDLPDFVISA